MEEALQNIRDWADKHGDSACLNRLLEILKDQWKIVEVRDLASELLEYDN